MTCITVWVSTAMIPTGIPPSFALPVITVFAQPSNVSTKLSLSNIPPNHLPSPS
uniref:ACC1 n=1 Tax=Arundo donax TaxID=35708 RepID=A0A0A9DYT1_ARUDO